jgi:pyruvate dehydrogenase kinase 2/3/4
MEDSRLGALRTVSSRPEGIWATVGEQVGRWQDNLPNALDHEIQNSSENDPEKEAGVGPHPRIGIGLPMSNIFAT